jgi:hypothetical protein
MVGSYGVGAWGLEINSHPPSAVTTDVELQVHIWVCSLTRCSFASYTSNNRFNNANLAQDHGNKGTSF